MGWSSNWASYWLAIPSVSAPSLIPAFIVDRINFGLKVLWVGWCSYCPTVVPAWLQELASSGSISPVL
ncbi:mCG141415 [Mus musculus]|nr:mCG141415 [Mus musculus]